MSVLSNDSSGLYKGLVYLRACWIVFFTNSSFKLRMYETSFVVHDLTYLDGNFPSFLLRKLKKKLCG